MKIVDKVLSTILRLLLKVLISICAAVVAFFASKNMLALLGLVESEITGGFALFMLAAAACAAYFAFRYTFRHPFSVFSVARRFCKPCAAVEPDIPAAPPAPPLAHPHSDEMRLLDVLRNRVCALSPSVQPVADIRDSYAKYGGPDAELLTIDLMEGHDFEYWCANALRDMGFEDVGVTPYSGDQGVDILAKKDGLRYAIQCKRYSSDLGNTPVQEVHAGKYYYHCHVAAVITNRHFTPGAKDLAISTGVLLWDRDWIIRYLSSKQGRDGSISISHAYADPPPIEAAPDVDEMLPAAIDVILETEQASVSVLQRRLNLGYARCARLIDDLEELGFIGPFQGSSPRPIYITREKWEAMLADNQ